MILIRRNNVKDLSKVLEIKNIITIIPCKKIFTEESRNIRICHTVKIAAEGMILQ